MISDHWRAQDLRRTESTAKPSNGRRREAERGTAGRVVGEEVERQDG